MTDPAKQEPEEEDELNPVGVEFWLGQILMIGGVAAGIWLSARAGFSEAARFSQHQDLRLARNTLRVVRKELDENLRQVRLARANLEKGKPTRVELRTLHLQKASGKSYMTAVNPRVLAEIERLYAGPLDRVLPEIKEGPIDPREVKRQLVTLERVLARADKTVLPLLAAQEEELARLEAKVRGGR